MSRIARKFRQLKARRRKALIAYVTAGFPTLGATGKVVREIEAAGADIVEIGVPFSDPIADGPVIQHASNKALENGVTLDWILKWTKKFRRASELPIVFMSYLNPVHHMGYEVFARRAADAGVDGLIVPDLIADEAGELRKVLRAKGIDLVHLVAPTTPPARRRRLARRSRGFLYAVSTTGVTGARKRLPDDVIGFLRDTRRDSPVPVAVGFGISNAEQARRYASSVDGVIVGSALISLLRKRAAVAPFIKTLRAALDEERRAGI